MTLWRQIQRQNFTKLECLLDYLELDAELRVKISSRPQFPLNVPARLAAKMPKNCLDDPIVRQFLPLQEERNKNFSYKQDPVGDRQARHAPKLLRKYNGRSLIVTTSACAMNCRYCFRQHFSYAEQPGFERELALIASDPSIKEVILSGGDPLSLGDTALGSLLNSLEQIAHIDLIRFHTRFPIGIPERIDASFLSMISRVKKQVVFVVHTNHAHEIDSDVADALKQIQRLGIPVLNQAVLLRGVNDSISALKELCHTLTSIGVMPYYLHQLDEVDGAAHFEVPEEEGLSLIEELESQLPGYAIPRYVKEIAGEPSKTNLMKRELCTL